jgi:cyclophilin family peptidyl-prolyl cis-trans isomerase
MLALWVPAAARADQVVRFTTTLGNIDVRLLSEDAPNTVTNFLSYANNGLYNNTVIQRSVPGFVIQGGGYTFTNNTFTPIATQPAITNEFKDSNVRGTLAMALTGSPANANSATDQWFFNLADNSSSLDSQLFTVFGKVVNADSLKVMDAIAAEPIDTTDSSPNGALPVLSASAGLTPTNLIYLNSVTLLNYPLPTITLSTPRDGSVFKIGQTVVPTYSCADAGGPGLASCTGSKTLDTSLFGTFKYTVTAVDDAGDTATKSISYTIVPYFIPKPPKPHAPLLSRPYRATKGGQLSLGLLCTAKVRCLGTLKVYTRRHHTLIGSTRYSVGQGHTWQQTVHINKTGRNLFKHARGKLPVTVALKPSGKHTHTRNHKLTLRVK